jgi:hypothetical protein
MSEPKSQPVVSDTAEINTADTPFIVAGYGETAKREGAKLKEVFNVRFLKKNTMQNVSSGAGLMLTVYSTRPSYSLQLRKLKLRGGARPRSICTVSYIGTPPMYRGEF